MYNTNGFIFDKDLLDEVTSALGRNGIFGAAAQHLNDAGLNKTVLLHKSYSAIGMNFPLLNQGNAGTCSSFAVAGGVDCLKAVEIANGENSEFKNITATEPIYRGGRLNNGRIIVRGDGAIVSLAVKYIHEYGTIARGKYGNIDLSEYSIDRSRRWGQNSGFPKSIEDISKQYTVEQYSRITSYKDWRDSIASGHPIIFGSNYGFSNTCNNDGFAKQNTNWSHAMWSCAIRADKLGVLIINSWGNWNKMSTRKFNEPLGSFWITAEDCDKIARNGDCWSIAGHNGYNKEIKTDIFFW